MANLFQRIKNKPIDEKWEIGFLDVSIKDILSGKPYKINVIQHKYKKGWFADPFILDVTDDTIVLLAEEWHYADRRGRISRLTIEKESYRLLDVVPILSIPSHLSFPAIIRKDDGIYIYPENARGDGLVLYRYCLETCKVEKQEILSTLPLLDSTIVDAWGFKSIFATTLDDPGRTMLWLSIDNGGTVLKDRIVFDDETARNAGDWFLLDGKMYRPAQDCNMCYGNAIILQEVSYLDDKLLFRDVVRMESNDPRYTTGLHTINEYKGVCVVDVHGYKYPWVAKKWNKMFNK